MSAGVGQVALFAAAGLGVYCVGFVVTYALQVRLCRYHGAGHRYESSRRVGLEQECDHSLHIERNGWPWVWPAVAVTAVVLCAVAAPFVVPFWATRQACQRIERRLRARHAAVATSAAGDSRLRERSRA